MAAIDYGAIAFKNGKLISTEVFTPMIDMVGWEDTESDTHTIYETNGEVEAPLNLKGNCFAYVGDKDCTIGFYKGRIIYVNKYSDGYFRYETENFYYTNYHWNKWEGYVDTVDMNMAKVTKRNGYLVFKWKYKGDKYKVYFGYGVDLPYYKKWHIVNYYHSPAFVFSSIKRWFKDKAYDVSFKFEERFK